MDAKADSTVEDVRHCYELRIRELHHRFANDMQLILALLHMEAKKAVGAEAKDMLAKTAERVGIVAKRRRAILDGAANDLAAALEQICGALNALAQGSPADVRLEVAKSLPLQSADTILPLTLAVNELATNALKYAFHARDRAQPGLGADQGPTGWRWRAVGHR